MNSWHTSISLSTPNSSQVFTMASFFQQSLATGWSFKDAEDNSAEAWMPVAHVPSVVHQDLIANNKYNPRILRPPSPPRSRVSN